MRITASSHPLAGKALRARHVYRRYGRIWLVVVLPDGGVCSVPVEDTDVLSAAPVTVARAGGSTISIEGTRRLLGLLAALSARAARSDTARETAR